MRDHNELKFFTRCDVFRDDSIRAHVLDYPTKEYSDEEIDE